MGRPECACTHELSTDYGMTQPQSSYAKRPLCFAEVERHQWNDWAWQQRNRLRTLEALEEVFALTPGEREAFEGSIDRFRVAITPHYASLMSQEDPLCPLRLQALPQPGELQVFDFELADPLAEEAHMPVAGLTHRYPDRALLYVSHNCPMYCRHCTRKRKVSDPSTAASRTQISEAIEHIERTPAIRDVIVSGGDPLTLSDARLADILSRLRGIQHVEVIRVGTRNPVTLPQRITPALADVLEEHGPIYLHTHFNHPGEISEESVRALELLRRAGCVLGNQMVLLRGINDRAQTVMELNRILLKHGCRPYYMLQCDMAQGITHFRTSIAEGLKIMDYLRGRIGGMGVPHFVVDLPGGGGKVELTPEYLVGEEEHPSGRRLTFRNFKGEEFEFVDVHSS